ncbi:hypothetical protein ACFL2K_05175 [Candidatus Margulisiibacteriota bacterium]
MSEKNHKKKHNLTNFDPDIINFKNKLIAVKNDTDVDSWTKVDPYQISISIGPKGKNSITINRSQLEINLHQIFSKLEGEDVINFNNELDKIYFAQEKNDINQAIYLTYKLGKKLGLYFEKPKIQVKTCCKHKHKTANINLKEKYKNLKPARIKEILGEITSATDSLEDPVMMAPIKKMVIEVKGGHYYDEKTLLDYASSNSGKELCCPHCRQKLKNNLVAISQFLKDLLKMLPIKGLNKNIIEKTQTKIEKLGIEDGDIKKLNQKIS